MKICHLTSVHPYRDTRIFIKECCSLAEHGYDVHLIAVNAPNEVIDGVKIHGIPFRAQNRLQRMTASVKLVYEKAVEIDAHVYHFHDPELIPIGLKLKKQGKKVIYDVHEDLPRDILTKTWIPGPLRKMIAFLIEKYENYASKKFDVIVSATPTINDRFQQIGCHTVNVNNYPIIREFVPTQGESVKKERAVCYIGGIGKIRGIFEMTQAIEKTDAILLLGGNFSDQNEKELVMKEKGWNKVNELGFLNRKEVSDVLQRSIAGLVVLHPVKNYLDALPVKMFEYMASGLPVIASNFPLWKKIIDDSQCGLCVDPLVPDEIASAIQWILDHPNEAKKMGENGQRAVMEKYNWGKEEQKLVTIYQSLS